jgi:hypothetical protein|nr:MAG TPA: hypothetical protein [Microviridae sp.]
MDFQEALKWAISQDVVKVTCIKVGEDDKFIFTVGQYSVSPLVFDSQEEAEQYLKENFRLTNLDLSIIGAISQRLNEINNEKF